MIFATSKPNRAAFASFSARTSSTIVYSFSVIISCGFLGNDLPFQQQLGNLANIVSEFK